MGENDGAKGAPRNHQLRVGDDELRRYQNNQLGKRTVDLRENQVMLVRID